MKWLIASDIHGSAYWCRRLLEAYKNEGADRMMILGDILYHGPRNDLPKEYDPKAVIAMLNAMNPAPFCVRGNCDCEVDQMVLEFPVLADYALRPIGSKTIFVTHGHKFNTSALPPMAKGDILLHGHTHIPKCEAFGDITYLNPGSVSIPKENSHHGYIILEENTFTWKSFDGETIMSYSVDK